MPFALLFIGVILIVAAVRGSQDDLFALVKGDFTGQSNFFYWVVVLVLIGSLGYVKAIQPLSRLFIGLILTVLFLTKGDPRQASGGFFEKFTQGIGVSTKTASSVGIGTGLGGTNAPEGQGAGLSPTIGNVLPDLSSLIH